MTRTGERLMTINLASGIDVAVVDDDPVTSSFLQTALERSGYAVLPCPLGVAAIPSIQAQGARVVIMDLMMREVHGVELFVMLRRVGPPLPVIFCTAAPRRLREMLPS
jgi:DNA-binding response OmpR family regulator